VSDETQSLSLSRRTVLLGAATLAGAGVVAACSPSGAPPGGPSGGGSGDGLVALDDVPVGGAVSATTASGAAVIIAQPTAGTVLGFSAICTHMGCTVAPDGAELKCPCHGSVYEAATGRNVDGPAPRPLDAFAVKIDGGQVVEA
jgi:Rieske Fe-S protein